MFKYKIFAIAFFAVALHADKIAVIDVEGMTCPLCTVAVKHSLKKTPGVIKAKVKLNTKQATVRFKDDINESILLDAVKKAGYKGKIKSLSTAP